MFCSNATDSRCSCVTYSACLVALYCFVRKEKIPKPKRELTGPIRHFYGLPARLLVSGSCSCWKVYLFCSSSSSFSSSSFSFSSFSFSSSSFLSCHDKGSCACRNEWKLSHWTAVFDSVSSRAVFLNRRAATSIIPGRERPEETTICYKISLAKLITNLNVILYLSTCNTVYISVLILFMIMP